MVKPKWKSEKEFNEYLVCEYLRYGSVDEVLKKHNYDLPTSYSNFHRILDKWDIVKAAGSNSRLAESIEFLAKIAEERTSLESVYNRTPSRFKASVATMHRILGYVKEGITRRLGTALVITPYNDRDKVLIAKDVSRPRIEFGKKYGAITIPMGFSRKRDTSTQAIKRVLQQEVFTDDAVKRKFPDGIVSEDLKPFLYLDIVDVRVEVFHLQLPKKYSNPKSFSSYKLDGFKFVDIDKLIKDKSGYKLRAGVKEGLLIYKHYQELLARNLTPNPMFDTALVNSRLASGLDV